MCYYMRQLQNLVGRVVPNARRRLVAEPPYQKNIEASGEARGERKNMLAKAKRILREGVLALKDVKNEVRPWVATGICVARRRSVG